MSGVTGFGSEIFESFKLSNEDEVFILTNKIRDVSRGDRKMESSGDHDE